MIFFGSLTGFVLVKLSSNLLTCRAASKRNPITASSLVTVESASVLMVADAVYAYRRGNFLSYFEAFSCRGRIEDQEDYADHRGCHIAISFPAPRRCNPANIPVNKSVNKQALRQSYLRTVLTTLKIFATGHQIKFRKARAVAVVTGKVGSATVLAKPPY